MALWYDVSDLMHWHLPHLTGIQRSVVGILNGLNTLGMDLKLISFDSKNLTFRSVEINDLPVEVRQHINIADIVASDFTDLEIKNKPKQIKKKIKNVIGDDPIARDLFSNVRDIRAAGISLPKNLIKLLKSRFSEEKSKSAYNSNSNKVYHLPGKQRNNSIESPDEEIILSFCATWMVPEHAAAVGSLRKSGVKVVRMIYDLIPTLKPQWVFEKDEEVFTRWAQALLRESDIILTISEFSKKEIERYCRLEDIKIPTVEVIRLGDEMSGQQNDSNTENSSSHLKPSMMPKRPFFLCVSTLDVRKNHRLLYDAWNIMMSRNPDNCPDLVCVGSKHYFTEDLIREIERNPIVNSRIHLLQDVNDRELDWYYKNCVATIYPSRYEGWGLPVAESLGYGRICLASHATSIPEISEDLPVFFDPLNVYELVELIDRCMQNKAWVKQKETEIKTNFKPTSWKKTAQQIMNTI